MTFFSADSILNEEGNVADNQGSVPVEYLHSCQPAALPPSDLKMKVGCPLPIDSHVQSLSKSWIHQENVKNLCRLCRLTWPR